MKNSIVQPMILAGGLGTRLRSVVSDRPKVMATVNGYPFIIYLLEQLIDDGFESVIILCGYLGAMIKDYFGNNYKTLDIIYNQEDTPLGTGGSIKLAAKKIPQEQILVLNGDTYNSVSKKLFVEEVPFKKEAILTKVVDDTSRYGRIEVDSNNKIISFNEKKPCKYSGIINAGSYIILKENILIYKKETFSLENEYFPMRIKNSEVLSIQKEGVFIDIGIPDDFYAASNIMKSIL